MTTHTHCSFSTCCASRHQDWVDVPFHRDGRMPPLRVCSPTAFYIARNGGPTPFLFHPLNFFRYTHLYHHCLHHPGPIILAFSDGPSPLVLLGLCSSRKSESGRRGQSDNHRVCNPTITTKRSNHCTSGWPGRLSQAFRTAVAAYLEVLGAASPVPCARKPTSRLNMYIDTFKPDNEQ